MYLKVKYLLSLHIYHSNAHREQTDDMIESKIVGIYYEDVEDKNGIFPFLRSMGDILI